MNKEKLLELIDDLVSKAESKAMENGPDQDYRCFAQEEQDEAREELIKFIEGGCE
jgi:hypothetical protein